MRYTRGFTLLELAIIFVLLVAVVVILTTAMRGHSRGPHFQIQNSTQLRGIHQGLVIFAQGNNLYYPGRNPDGSDGNLSVEGRLLTLLNANIFTPDFLINYADPAKTAWQSGPFTSDHYSYAMLQVPPQGARRDEWRDTINTAAIVLTDRNTGTAAQPTSVWNSYRRPGIQVLGLTLTYSRPYAGQPWLGTVVRNDGWTQFETTHTFDTQYGSITTQHDHLFEAARDDDAYLIHSGNQ